ncbi:M48 family metalloprotease [Alphaproteobacteria bacterium GH1-50]|uniref:M48 family metalloprotease n=1 Tax=Kangsaoukella pontilimi TaxID=2691042 RepID=A0A7C9IHF7_9RHOB|nr:M48 family metalloprotease [Kangsaoukella pontilimi]MXQ08669.1 M48 family metalloprotease [Kangsaoukella pontilimi]
MIRTGAFVLGVLTLAACAPVEPNVPSGTGPLAPEPVARTGSPQSLADFRAVVGRVEPVAEAACRQMQPRANCDFRIVLDDRPNQPPNAYQTYDRSGQPIIAFTPALVREMQNRDELAFALSHEAAHHIEGHIAQTQASGTTGALIGTVLGSIVGLDTAGVETAQNIGGTIGARRYSKGFELEADSLGARIALRAGYDPVRGVLYFQRAPDPGDRFLGTHPPNADRITVVRRTVAAN